MRVRKHSALYAYLDKQGLLSKGTAEEIIAAKEAYWKKVRTEWQKNKRTNNKKYEVFLNKIEYQIIARAAKSTGYSKVAYLKQSALAYTNKKYLVPRIELLYDVKELLALTYDSMQQLVEEKNVPVSLGDILLTKIEHLENRILELLFNPKETA